jgi:chromosome segregation ATPase
LKYTFSNTKTMQRDGVMQRLREKVIDLEAMVYRAAIDLEAAQAKIDKLTTELNEQKTARTAAEQAAEVLSVTISQMQTRIDDLLTELNTQLANAQAVYATQTAALADQTEATHEAEKRAIAAEATAASLNLQVNELKATIEQLRALINGPVPSEAKA